MNELFIRKKEWLKFTPEEMKEYVDKVYVYYKNERGFPYYPTDEEYREEKFQKLLEYTTRSQVLKKTDNETIISQTMHGLALAWSYFPHSWNVPVNDKRTPLQNFMDDKIFKKIIQKRIQMGDNMSDSGIRKTLKMYTGSQGVSNFRPTAAHAIINHFTRVGDWVLDPCAGYGGRMLGAICANVNYTGLEPDERTWEGLTQIADTYTGYPNNVFAVPWCAENWWAHEHYDFAITSPPYFDTEKYSDAPDQSYMKFPTYQKWKYGFLYRMIENVYKSLKPDSYFVLNIADIKKHRLTIDACECAGAVGFELKSTWKYALSNPQFKNAKAKFKYEPLLILYKNG